MRIVLLAFLFPALQGKASVCLAQPNPGAAAAKAQSEAISSATTTNTRKALPQARPRRVDPPKSKGHQKETRAPAASVRGH